MSDKTIEQVLGEKAPGWMEVPGVVAVAQGLYKGRPCILVLTDAEPSSIKNILGECVEGFPVVVRRSGPMKARRG